MKSSTESRAEYKVWCEQNGYKPGEIKSREAYNKAKVKNKPGRKPKSEKGAMTAAERKKSEREKRKENGEVQRWLTPDEIKLIDEYRKEK